MGRSRSGCAGALSICFAAALGCSGEAAGLVAVDAAAAELPDDVTRQPQRDVAQRGDLASEPAPELEPDTAAPDASPERPIVPAGECKLDMTYAGCGTVGETCRVCHGVDLVLCDCRVDSDSADPHWVCGFIRCPEGWDGGRTD